MKFVKALKSIHLYSLTAALLAIPAVAQTFSSGSTGSDGALSFTSPGTYIFDPKKFSPPLNPANDGVFNFTTITIASGVTVKLIGSVLNTPVAWLAQGAVKIDGIMDLSGQDGFIATNTTQRTTTIPGSGGYGGGYPAVGANPAGAGLGPAGGASIGCPGGDGGNTSNQFLVPLTGGSGGGGLGAVAGGAGGGAILIASSISISGIGSIKATGGGRVDGGYNAGAGGSIRLVAPDISISGALDASGATGCSRRPNGIVRVEAFVIGSINASGPFYTATPFGLFLSPSGVPALSVISVGGNPVATSPTGTFTVPDVTVSSASPLPVAIKAANIPMGTVVTLVVFSENGPDQTILSTPLAGTLASSTATATVTLPPGFSKGFVKAAF